MYIYIYMYIYITHTHTHTHTHNNEYIRFHRTVFVCGSLTNPPCLIEREPLRSSSAFCLCSRRKLTARRMSPTALLEN